MRKRLLGLAALVLAVLFSARLGLSVHEPFFIYCPPAGATDTSMQAEGTAQTGKSPVVDLPLPFIPKEADAGLTPPGKPASDPQLLHQFLMKAFED